MSRLARGFILAALMTPSVVASPHGVWELETRDTRFSVELCGDGSQLCGMLVWLSDDDYNDQYQPYLHRAMAERMEADGPNRWKGRMQLMGHRLNGTITQHSENHMTLSGCAFLVVCKTYQMYRYSQ